MNPGLRVAVTVNVAGLPGAIIGESNLTASVNGGFSVTARARTLQIAQLAADYRPGAYLTCYRIAIDRGLARDAKLQGFQGQGAGRSDGDSAANLARLLRLTHRNRHLPRQLRRADHADLDRS